MRAQHGTHFLNPIFKGCARDLTCPEPPHRGLHATFAVVFTSSQKRKSLVTIKYNHDCAGIYDQCGWLLP